VPRRTTYANPETGRFVSGADIGSFENIIRSVYDNGLVERQVLTFGQVSEIITGGPGIPDIEPSKWGARIHDEEDNPLDINLLNNMGIPDGYDQFRVTYFVKDNPDYPRKYASDEWLGADQWPPELDVLDNAQATGIAHIVFRRGTEDA
jgi:hypothetical protein